MVHGGGERDRAWSQPRASVKQRRAFEKIETRGADELSRNDALQGLDQSAFVACILLNENCVCAFRRWRAGEDPHRLHGAKAAGKTVTCGAFANLFQTHGEAPKIGG